MLGGSHGQGKTFRKTHAAGLRKRRTAVFLNVETPPGEYGHEREPRSWIEKGPALDAHGSWGARCPGWSGLWRYRFRISRQRRPALDWNRPLRIARTARQRLSGGCRMAKPR